MLIPSCPMWLLVCRWPWDKYRMGLEQAPGGPQRTFLVLVLQQLVRLTAWDHPLLRQVRL